MSAAELEGARRLFKELIAGDSGGFIPAEAGVKDKNGKADDWVSVGWIFECFEKVAALLEAPDDPA